MSWLLNKLGNKSAQKTNTQDKNSEDPISIRYEVFKSHWLQLHAIIKGHQQLQESERFVRTSETSMQISLPVDVSQDDVDASRNLLEQMIFLLTEEQTSGIPLGPILEYVITHGIFNQLFNWTMQAREYKMQLLVNQLKIYEVLISQAEPSLLHHKQLVNPLWNTISEASDLRLEEVDGHIVILLNLLCVWMNRYPTLLDVFFHSTDKHGATNFLMFSLLVNFIHREGSVGQGARDALLLVMTLSLENEEVADYIVKSSNFCPVLATGLSGLYSSLPRQMDVRADDWHCLTKHDWSHVPALVNFMNCLEFCNGVIEASHEKVSAQLLNYIFNGFLVSVFGPALHKVSTEEVVVTTAYLNLFLRSVTAPGLMKCFLRFLLMHHHDNALIINTLIQRIASNNRLALVSLSLFRTLLDLNCEDLMLHLIFRYLIPCKHLLASQRRALCDVDMYNSSATRFLQLTPKSCLANNRTSSFLKPVHNDSTPPLTPLRDVDQHSGGSRTISETSIPPETATSQYTVNEDLSVTINMNPDVESSSPNLPQSQVGVVQSPHTMAEFGSDLQSQIDLNTSYMDYLEDANTSITECSKACALWSAPYDGDDPSPESVDSDHVNAVIPNSRTSSIQSSVTTSDPIQSSLDPALQALNATYQALNLTALAFNGSQIKGDEITKDSGIEHDLQNTETAPVMNGGEDISTLENDTEFETNTEYDVENSDIINELNIEYEDVNIEKYAVNESGDASAGKDKASVDDFFRSLMESVPKNMKNPLEEENGDNKENEPEETNLEENSNDQDSDDSLSYHGSMEEEDWESSDNISCSSFYEHEYLPTEQSLTPAAPINMHGAPYTGPFLSTLFGKLEQLVGNSLYENLLLTGIMARLACYNQPLLRSFLLNTRMVFHPSVKSLYQVLNNARLKIDQYSENIVDFDVLLHRAQKYLLARGKLPLPGNAQNRSLIQEQPMPVPKVKTRNTILGDVFLRRKKNKLKKKKSGGMSIALDTLIEKGTQKIRSGVTKEDTTASSKFYIRRQADEQKNRDKFANEMRTKNAVYATIVITEFLKELAAISQEHAVSTFTWQH